VYVPLARRYGNRIHEGGLLVWALLGLTVSFAIPAVSYPHVRPARVGLVEVYKRRLAAEWIAAVVGITMLAGFAYAATVVMLGVGGAGAMALVILVSMLAWLAAPLLARVFGDWRLAIGIMLPLAIVVGLIGKATVRHNGDHPVRTSLIYAQNANDNSAFFGSASQREPWTRMVLGRTTRGADWTTRLGPSVQYLYGHEMPSASLEAPIVSAVSDSTSGDARTLAVRVTAPRGTTAMVVRAIGAAVHRASIDGRVVDTSRFRQRSTTWSMEYWNVPPEGVVFQFTVDAGASLTVEVAARRPGLPAPLTIPARPDSVVASQGGDASGGVRAARF